MDLQFSGVPRSELEDRITRLVLNNTTFREEIAQLHESLIMKKATVKKRAPRKRKQPSVIEPVIECAFRSCDCGRCSSSLGVFDGDPEPLFELRIGGKLDSSRKARIDRLVHDLFRECAGVVCKELN
jgi:hypothetical protein